MAIQINNFRIEGPEADFVESPNQSGPFADDQPDTIILHYTAGSSAKSSVTTLCDPEAKASAHLVIGRNGEITQLVPFNVIAWHAGASQYQGRTGFNKYSLGIEIDNAGRLSKSGAGFESWFGRVYPEAEVFEGTHRNESVPTFWHRFTEAQIETVRAVCNVLVRTYGIRYILGHEEIAPKRKTDPGPAFPLDKLRQVILASDRSLDAPEEGVPADSGSPETFSSRTGLVTATRLNIRAKPSIGSDTVAQPLPSGTLVEILDEVQGWYRVEVHTRGWVAKDFIKT